MPSPVAGIAKVAVVAGAGSAKCAGIAEAGLAEFAVVAGAGLAKCAGVAEAGLAEIAGATAGCRRMVEVTGGQPPLDCQHYRQCTLGKELRVPSGRKALLV